MMRCQVPFSGEAVSNAQAHDRWRLPALGARHSGCLTVDGALLTWGTFPRSFRTQHTSPLPRGCTPPPRGAASMRHAADVVTGRGDWGRLGHGTPHRDELVHAPTTNHTTNHITNR
jgi:hypothetical protein